MDFKYFYANKILTEDYNIKNYGPIQGDIVLPHFIKFFGYKSEQEFQNADMQKFMQILKAFNAVVKSKFGVDSKGNPNTDDTDQLLDDENAQSDQKVEGPWSKTHPKHKKMINDLIREVEKLVAPAMSAQPQA